MVAADAEQATSFGNVAETYDRVRPGPPGPALDWLVPAGCGVAVDLAAGTGLFTRALLGRAARVVAVEPDPRMRDVLARRTPGLDVRAGRGEAMPLPDASADAVFVSTAWHWLDLPRAVPEIARVLRPGGRLGIIWTSRDRDDDWVAELDLVQLNTADVSSPGDGPGPGDRPPPTVADVRASLERHHAVTLPAGAPFGPLQTASFRFARTMPVTDVIEWLASNSDFITASPGVQAATTARWRAALESRARRDPSGAGPAVDLPSRSWCWRTERR